MGNALLFAWLIKFEVFNCLWELYFLNESCTLIFKPGRSETLYPGHEVALEEFRQQGLVVKFGRSKPEP